LLPLKLICTQSGQALPVPSFQPPPLPQFTPARSLLLTAATGKPALMVLEAEATAPLLARATLLAPAALTPCYRGVLLEAALPASPA